MRTLISRLHTRHILYGLIAVMVGWLGLQLSLMLIVHFYGISQPAATRADVLIVLGAGVNRDGRAGPALTRRSQLGAQLYGSGVAPLMVCTGGQPWNRSNTEANACRDLLLNLNVPDAAILREANSHSTEENARNTATLLNAQQLRVVVVSDSYHLLRAGWLFRNQGFEVQLAGVSPERSVSASNYLFSVMREAVALQWQFVKDLFGLDITRIPLL